MNALFQDFLFSLRQLHWPLSRLCQQPCQRWKRPRSTPWSLCTTN